MNQHHGCRTPARLALLFVLLPAIACRTTRPSGTERRLEPLRATGRDSVVLELARRLEAIHAVRSLMRVRVTTGDRTQSFRAQLVVEPRSKRVRLIAYTPIGIEAVSLTTEGDRVVFLDHLTMTAWQGGVAELARSIPFLDPQITPVPWALDVVGFPSQGEFEASESGLARIVVGNASLTFDPPAFPPRNVTVTRDGTRLDITHLDLVSTDATLPPLEIPRQYRCCVPPRM